MKSTLIATTLLVTSGLCAAEPAHVLATWSPPTAGGIAAGYHVNFCKDMMAATPTNCSWLSPATQIDDASITMATHNIDTVVDVAAALGVRVRSFNALGAPSPWMYAGPITVPSTPGAVENLSISVESGNAP